jgi:FtsZ-binding cell division protein ZapB
MTEREILLHLKRKYSKDETVSMLMLEIGKLKAELSEVSDLNRKYEQQIKDLKDRNFMLKTKVKAKKQRTIPIIYSEHLPEKFKAKVEAINSAIAK